MQQDYKINHGKVRREKILSDVQKLDKSKIIKQLNNELHPLAKAATIILVFGSVSGLIITQIELGIVSWLEIYLPSIAVFGVTGFSSILIAAVIILGCNELVQKYRLRN